MQDLHQPKRTYRIPQQSVPRAVGESVLQYVALPGAVAAGNGSSSGESINDAKAARRSKLLRNSVPPTSRASRVSRHSLLPREPSLPNFDALAFVSRLDAASLTDAEAEAITYPFHPHAYTWVEVLEALQARLAATVDAIAWNHPRVRPGWDKDLRFLGDWWLSLRDQDTLASQKTRVGMNVVDMTATATALKPRRGETNRPFLLPDERTTWAEDQLVADFALRLHERLFRLETIHIDELALTPDRVQVLLLSGLAQTQAREAEKLAATAATRMNATCASPPDVGIATEEAPPPGLLPSPRDDRTPYFSRVSHNNTPSLSQRKARATSSLSVSFRVAEPGPADHHDTGPSQPLPDLPSTLLHVTSISGTLDAMSPTAADKASLATVDTQYLLETLSLSICSIGTASALVLLASLVTLEDARVEHERTVPRRKRERGEAPLVTPLRAIVNVDLSYNALTAHSLYCLAVLLPKTAIRRLSLRGNNLCGGDSAATRDFLLEGCHFLEELDLGYTNLSIQQICILIEALPSMQQLHFLRLDNLDIPPEKSTALSRAVYQSQLWSISLNGCVACSSQTYLSFINAACERHRARAVGQAHADTIAGSFFERFFSKSMTKGWVPPDLRALPAGYGPFHNNDPSLYLRAVH